MRARIQQLGIFIRGVFSDFGSLTTSNEKYNSGEDILKAVLQCTSSMNVDLRKLVSVTTYGNCDDWKS